MKRIVNYVTVVLLAGLVMASCGYKAQKDEAANQEQTLQNEKQEAQRNYEEAIRKAEQAQTWLENSVNEFEELLVRQRNAETLDEYNEIEKQKVDMKNTRDEKIREREQYLSEAEIYKRQIESY